MPKWSTTYDIAYTNQEHHKLLFHGGKKHMYMHNNLNNDKQ